MVKDNKYEYIICVYRQLRGREKLDGYLSSALGVPLKDRRLQDIDEAKYVLTLDYTVKVCVSACVHACVCVCLHVCESVCSCMCSITMCTNRVFAITLYTDVEYP